MKFNLALIIAITVFALSILGPHLSWLDCIKSASDQQH